MVPGLPPQRPLRSLHYRQTHQEPRREAMGTARAVATRASLHRRSRGTRHANGSSSSSLVGSLSSGPLWEERWAERWGTTATTALLRARPMLERVVVGEAATNTGSTGAATNTLGVATTTSLGAGTNAPGSGQTDSSTPTATGAPPGQASSTGGPGGVGTAATVVQAAAESEATSPTFFAAGVGSQ